MPNLTAVSVKQAKPKPKQYKLTDGGGMYLLVLPTGGRYWRYNYRYNTKRKTLALGVYPDISLADARNLHTNARESLARGSDPAAAKKIQKLTQSQAAADSFEAVGREWFSRHMEDQSVKHQARALSILEKDLYPAIGPRPISQVASTELLTVLRKIEDRGAIDIAHRAKHTAGAIFRYAVATGRAERDPSRDLTGALRQRKVRHLAAITDPVEVGKLMLALGVYQGSLVVKTALKISALLFQRPGEIRHMEWTEINWDQSRWEIPAKKMKMRDPHIVPLSWQAIDLLEELQRLTGRGRYVFPSARGGGRPLSENGVRVALRTMGYTNDQMTSHGFRAMARTILDEVLGVRPDYIEHQLAHAVRDPNGRAYNRTSHLLERQKMMQQWSDYLDKLRTSATAAEHHTQDDPDGNSDSSLLALENAQSMVPNHPRGLELTAKLIK